MTILPQSVKRFLRKSQMLVSLNSRLHWKVYLLKDWWGTIVWRRTTQVETPQGFKFTSGFHPAYRLMRAGQFEVEETALVAKLLDQVDLFVDIGANIGYYTCLALKKGKPVIAFEPQQQNLQCLFQNLLSNGWRDNVEVFPLALSANAGLLTLWGASGPSASLVRNWAGYSPRHSQIVPVSTLDNIVAGRFSEKKILIKIDVEGAEYQVLRGSESVLKRSPKPIWLVEICLDEFHPGKPNPDYLKTFELFWESGYHVYRASGIPQPVTRDDVTRWVNAGKGDSGTFNYLFAESGEVLD
jgi:FkbM family methyltransferase